MSRDMEDRINAVATSQHGVVTRAQLLDLGLSPAAIGRRLAAGRLRALHRGVYLVGPTKPPRAAELAAVLAGGRRAVLSHASAAAIWGMLRPNGSAPVQVAAAIHVSVSGSGRRYRPGIQFHRVVRLDDDERTVVDGIPITTPARTLADIAGLVGSRELESAAAAAKREGLIDGDALRALVDRYRARPGMAMLRELIQDQVGPSFLRSEAERLCLQLLRTARLPQPHTNVPMGPYELDLFWPDEMVAIEVDGWAHHSSRPRFEGDRRKDMWLRARGIEVIRVTWRQITRDPTATAVQIGQALALARARRMSMSPRAGSAPSTY